MTPLGKSLTTHGILLALAAGAAAHVWLRESAPPAAITRDVVVWKGRETDIVRMELTKPGLSVVLEAKADATGRWYEGKLKNDRSPSADGGTEPKQSIFVSVTPATKAGEKLADLRAVRNLGRVPGERMADYGLRDADAHFRIVLSNETRELVLGAHAPGGSDQYVRDEKSGEVFVVETEPFRQLESAQFSLVERDLHGFPIDPDVERLEIVRADKRRGIVRRGPVTARFYADPSAPDKADETFTTWMTKVDRMRPVEFVAAEPAFDPAARIRIDYAGSKTKLGFIEVARASGDGEIYLRTERTRMWAKVIKSSGDQVISDLATIVP